MMTKPRTTTAAPAAGITAPATGKTPSFAPVRGTAVTLKQYKISPMTSTEACNTAEAVRYVLDLHERKIHIINVSNKRMHPTPTKS
jgi:hypothetical protein